MVMEMRKGKEKKNRSLESLLEQDTISPINFNVKLFIFSFNLIILLFLEVFFHLQMITIIHYYTLFLLRCRL